MFDQLAPHAGEFVRPAVFSIDRLLGKLSALSGNDAAAKTYFSASIDLCLDRGYVVVLARAQTDHAEFLTGLGSPSDTAAASELLATAHASAERLGMKTLVGRIEGLIDRIAVPLAPATAHPDGLTGRELEVLKELATGKSNREIAEVLFITQNTVIRHVANIFSKTGSANRAQAAVYAERHALQSCRRAIGFKTPGPEPYPFDKKHVLHPSRSQYTRTDARPARAIRSRKPANLYGSRSYGECRNSGDDR